VKKTWRNAVKLSFCLIRMVRVMLGMQ